MSKRYVLYLAESPLSDSEVRFLEDVFKKRHPGLKVIAVRSNARAIVVKGDVRTAQELRVEGGLTVGDGVRLVPSLTSGAIGKLKKRGAEAARRWRNT